MTQQRHEQSRVATRPFVGGIARNARAEKRPSGGGKRLASAAEHAPGRAGRASCRAHRGVGAPSRPRQRQQRQAAFGRWAEEAEVEAANPKPARQIGPQARWPAGPQGRDAAPRRSPGPGEGACPGFLRGMRFAAVGSGQSGNAARPPSVRSARAASTGGDRAPGACQVLRALRDGARAAFPDGVSAPVQYGPRIAGVAVYLQHVRRAGDGCDAGDDEREGSRAAAGRGLAPTGPGGGHGAHVDRKSSKWAGRSQHLAANSRNRSYVHKR